MRTNRFVHHMVHRVVHGMEWVINNRSHSSANVGIFAGWPNDISENVVVFQPVETTFQLPLGMPLFHVLLVVNVRPNLEMFHQRFCTSAHKHDCKNSNGNGCSDKLVGIAVFRGKITSTSIRDGSSQPSKSQHVHELQTDPFVQVTSWSFSF